MTLISGRSIAAVWLLMVLSISANAQQDVTLSTASGEKLNLSSLHGKVVLLVFSSLQDPQCRDEFKALDFLAGKYRDRNVAVYWVSINPAAGIDDEKLARACGPHGSVSILDDPNQAAFKRFANKVPRIPTIVFLDKKGHSSGQPLGGFNPDPDFVDSLSSTIDNLLITK